MGSKGSATTTQQVTIPPEVLARYNAVNAQAQQVAQTPFQAYSNDPNAFVAPLTSTQQSGIANTNAYANAAQPAYQAGMGLTLAGAQAANPNQIGGQQIGQYMSPYLGSVVGTTLAAQQMQNAQQASNLQGQGIAAGAFGGDRSNIAGANLAYQQNMANQQTLANELNTGYNTALATAQQQQGVDLAAQQANLARLTQAGAQLGNLGAGAQTAGLTGAQAQLAAGQAQQQTEQAGLSALYNQFLQQQAYPFQTTQFLANIAEGTGALSGSTTTTTQPAPFFSDERLKDDKEVIGKTFDGQPIYKFKYKGDDRTQIGLMAQDVEKKHPEAVGLAAGYKTVDYDSATKDAAHKGHYAEGGLIPNSMGGAVTDGTMGRQAFADDGFVDPAFSNEPDYNDIANMRQYMMDQQQQGQGMARGGLAGRSHYDVGGSTFNPWALYGSYGTPFQALSEQAQFLKRGDPSLGSVPGRGSYAGAGLQGAGSPHDLLRAGSIPQLPQSGFNQAVDMGTKLAGLGEFGMKVHDKFFSDGSQKPQTTQTTQTTNNTSTSSSGTNNPPQTNQTNQQHTELTNPSQNKIASNDNPDQEQQISLNDDQLDNFSYRGGLIKARHHYKFGGGDPNSDSDSDTSDTPYAGVDPTAYVGSSVPKSRLVPDVENKYKLATPSNMPGDPNAQNTGLATAARTADLGTKLYKGYDYLKGLSGASKVAPDLMEGAKAADAVETSGGGLMAGVDPAALSAQIGNTAGTVLDASGAASAAATGATAAETAGATAAADAAGAAAAGGAAAGGGLLASIGDALGSVFSFLPALLASGGAVRPHRAMGGPVRRRVPPSLAAAFALGHALGKRINLNPPSPLPTGIAPSRYADGGLVPRNAYATDGSVDQPSNDNLYGNMINIESGNRQTTNKGEPLTSPRGAIGIAQIMPATAPEAAKLAGVDFDPDRLKTDPDYNMRLGKAYFDKQVQDFGDPMIAAAAYNAGPARVRQALNRAQDEGGDYTDYLPRETQAYVSHLALAAHGANTAVQNRLSGNEKPTGLNPQLVSLDTGTMSDASNDIRSTIPSGGTPTALATTESPAAPTSQGLAAAKNQALNRFDIDDQANRNQRESVSGLAPAAPVSATAPSGGLGGSGGQPQQDKNEKYLGLFPKEKTDTLLKSSDFWIPLIAGVGSMLGSHSLSLAGAIGDGLVGGSTAWMKNQELQAAVDQTKAKTAETYAGIAGDAFRMVNGVAQVRVLNPDGTYKFVPWSEYNKNSDQYNIDPRAISDMKKYYSMAGIDQDQTNQPSVRNNVPATNGTTTAPASTTAAPASTTAGPQATTQNVSNVTKPYVMDPFQLTPALIQKAHNESDLVQRLPQDEREKFNFDSQGSNIYDTLSNKALDSQYQSRNLMQLASHISETPDSGLLAMGALNPIAQGAANITNWGLRAAHGNPLAEKDIANYVSIDKLVDQMQREAASASGQHSYSAYDQASKSFPNTTKSKEGAIDNIANIIVNNKQNDDAKTFASKYQNEARSKNDTFARYTGQNLNQDFVNTYGPLYEHDRQSIGQMLRDKVTDPVSKEPISMFTYVMKYGDKLSDEAKVAIDRKYGKDGQPEILRYFPTVKQ